MYNKWLLLILNQSRYWNVICLQFSLSIITLPFFFFSASIGRTLAIGSLYDPTKLFTFVLKEIFQSFIINDNFEVNFETNILDAAGEVAFCQINLLGNLSDITWLKGKIHILCSYKLAIIVFWFKDNGITFVDITTKGKLLNTSISTEKNNDIWVSGISRSDMFKFPKNFPENNKIRVGWGCDL